MKEATFLEHLDEFRRRLLVSVMAFLAAAAGCLYFSDKLLVWALTPARQEIDALYFFSPSDAFIVRVQMALLAGFALASPVVFYQMWLFVSPAMHRHEKKALIPAALISGILFAAGAFFAYYQILPAALHFLLSMQNQWLRPMISVSQYVSFFNMTLISFGLAFNLPVFILALTASGILNARVLMQFQRQIVVLIFIAAAILTPGPDIASQLLLAFPLLVLFEVSVAVAYGMEKIKKAGAEKKAATGGARG